MRHEEFAERVAGRVAAALDEEERRIGRNPVAAHMLRDASEAVARAVERRSA